MKRASICASSRKGYNSNLNIMFQHMIDNKELFNEYILCGDEDDAYNDNLQCYFPIGAVRSAQIKLVAPLPLNLLIEHEKSIMMFIATDTSKAMKRNNVAIEEDFQGMVIGDDNDDENDVEIIDEDGGYVDDVPVTVRRANDDDDDNNHDDIVLPTTDETLIDVLRNQPTISAGGLQGYKSALKKYYTENSIVLDKSIDQELDLFIKNYKRLIADKKARGIMNIHEGKSEISFSGYISIADGLRKNKPEGVKGCWSDSMMAWPYFVMSWNLMCRTNNVASLMLENVDWKDDSLLIFFAKTKTDQMNAASNSAKTRGFIGKHVYANPKNPAICPITSLALYFASVDNLAFKDNHQIFKGKDEKNRFTKILGKVVNLIPAYIDLGASRKDIGTHSTRKGSADYCLGLNDGPTAVNVYLRAGWTLGDVIDRYIMGGGGGDELVGRVLAGLAINDIDFAILPPHFSTEGRRYILEELGGFSFFFPSYEIFPQGMKRAAPFIAASLVYHYEWLLTEFVQEHPFRQSTLVSQHYNKMLHLREFVLVGHFECENTNLRCTGVPSAVKILNALEEQKAAFERTKNSIIDAVNEIPDKVADIITKNFQIEGVSQISQAQLQNMMTEQTRNMIASVNEIIRNATATAPLQGNINTPNARNNDVNNNEPNHNPTWAFFDWNDGKGSIHAVPLDYKLPSVPTHMMFQTWHLGHQEKNIRPFKAINPSLDFPTRYGKTLYCRLKYVMNAITEKGLHLLDLRPTTNIGCNNCEEVFLKGYLPYLQDVYGTQPKRPLEITPVTIYNKKFSKRARRTNDDLNAID
jgi:hypothetical protein